jgi:hypothetical protein
MVHIIPTVDTILVVCLTEDQEDGDLILDLMVDLIKFLKDVIHHSISNKAFGSIVKFMLY